MKIIVKVLLSLLIALQSCAQTPEEILNQTKTKFFDSQSLSFNTEAYLQNPATGKIDTARVKFDCVKNKKSITGYDAVVVDQEHFEDFFIDGEYKHVNHFKKTVSLFTDQKPEYKKAVLESTSSYNRSPMILLRDYEWKFVKDTVINEKNMKDYYRITNDKVVNGNTIYTEQHLFINPQSKLLERWERRNYFKGSLSQRLVYIFKDYKFNYIDEKLEFNTPSNYISKLFSQKEEVPPLKKGETAPNFELQELSGQFYSLEAFEGEKILLKFSSVGCGNSHEALLYMNEEDYELSDDIKPLYLSIWEKEADVREYFSVIKASMPVLLNAEDIAKEYKVTSTPTFILIDENGLIENVTIGNDKDFLNSLITSDTSNSHD
jgi:hypothetical protein